MSDFKRIAPEKAAELIEKGAGLVDIRDPQSYDAGHIPAATRLDNETLPQYLASADKALPLIVCCYHGNSSQPAAAFLAEAGFDEVYSLDGGFELWRQQYPTQVIRSGD